MSQLIVYQIGNNPLAVIMPAPQSGLTIQQIALKDVPPGVPYKIIQSSDLPPDAIFRDAWEMGTTDYDGQGADYGIGSQNKVVGWNSDGSPRTALDV
jgi:hypothetical protein